MNLKKMYFYLPHDVQNMGISGYAWYRDKFFRKNKYYPEAKKLVDKINSSTQEEIENWQLKQLNWIVNYAIQHTSFYKDYYGVNEIEFNSFDDFKQLPTIDKQLVRKNWKAFQIKTKDKVFKTKTSGTTGSSLDLRVSAKTTAMERAGYEYLRSISGFRNGHRVASFFGRKIMTQSRSTPPFWRFNKYDNQLLFSNWHINDNNLQDYIRKYNSFKPQFVNGYASFLYFISDFALRNNIELFSPNGVVTGSETLLPHFRDKIEKAFGAQVYDHYGSAEFITVAHQCQNKKYHIREELGYLETINGVNYGSTFHNIAMPLIRYKIGDLMKIKTADCTCKMGGRIITNISGREQDVLISKDGVKYGNLNKLFIDISTIKEAQIIQETIESLTLNIVPQNNKDLDLGKLRLLIKEKLGDNFQIKFNVLRKIPRTKNGKFKFVISKLDK